jgi:hypothetical protein
MKEEGGGSGEVVEEEARVEEDELEKEEAGVEENKLEEEGRDKGKGSQPFQIL